MAEFSNTMDVFKLLEKTNCRKCNKPTCLAFAAAVFQGQIALSDCPFVSEKILEEYGAGRQAYESTFEQDYIKVMTELKARVKQRFSQAEPAELADQLGGRCMNGRLTLKILGKDFSIDPTGEIITDIHVNPWIAPPVLNYVVSSKGVPLAGSWVPFRELASSKDWARFFEYQCEGALKKVADTYPAFFEDIIELFNGRQVENHYDADIALIIHPLPLLPMLICYNHPEEGLESDLNLFFDSTADQNLPVQNIYTLSTGLANMFKKLAINHG
ncbi:MAG: DUF3786 domain-containing protein [Desulfobacteraceae bacterium]|nr:MAG: DUF3786 domain-containing protein [Desulfobacteraceae bacterium]